ncbi:MAG: hypothetical protein WDW38_000294 [Sanguina aurantia]
MLRMNGVLVVSPFDAAWLEGDVSLTQAGNGCCVTFEAKGVNDITVMFKCRPGSKRLQPLQLQQHGQNSAVEDNYTVIFGSHRNSCLKVEKNGVTHAMATGVAGAVISDREFTALWVDCNQGVLTIGSGSIPGQRVSLRWTDPAGPIPNLQHVALSAWDAHVSYRSTRVLPPRDAALLALQPAAQDRRPSSGGNGGSSSSGGGGSADTGISSSRSGMHAREGGDSGAVPTLFDACQEQLIQQCEARSVLGMLSVAELLLPNTQGLYRHCLEQAARWFAQLGADATVGKEDACWGPESRDGLASPASASAAAAAVAGAGAGAGTAAASLPGCHAPRAAHDDSSARTSGSEAAPTSTCVRPSTPQQPTDKPVTGVGGGSAQHRMLLDLVLHSPLTESHLDASTAPARRLLLQSLSPSVIADMLDQSTFEIREKAIFDIVLIWAESQVGAARAQTTLTPVQASGRSPPRTLSDHTPPYSSVAAQQHHTPSQPPANGAGMQGREPGSVPAGAIGSGDNGCSSGSDGSGSDGSGSDGSGGDGSGGDGSGGDGSGSDGEAERMHGVGTGCAQQGSRVEGAGRARRRAGSTWRD